MVKVVEATINVFAATMISMRMVPDNGYDIVLGGNLWLRNRLPTVLAIVDTL